MPPKKKDDKKQGLMLDEDMSDAATLPPLNDFVFFSLYAFKYRRNRLNLEKMLFQEFYVFPEGETAELSKRNRVIQISDLLNQAKAKQYLTEEEAGNISTIDETKLRQVLARCTNELLISSILPLRRLKAEQDRIFLESLEKIADKDKETAKRARFEKTSKELDLCVWLKDFPRDAQDFQELRRSNAQHQPEVEVAVHGVFLVEEMFKRDADDNDGPIAGLADSKQDDEERRKIKSQQFTKEDRVKAFNDLVFLNKFARNCPSNSQMKLMTALKLPFHGPDPPMDLPEPVIQEPVQTAPPVEEKRKDSKGGKAGAKDKVVEEEKPVEIPKSPEELAELAMIFEFVKEFRRQVTSACNDLSAYRALLHSQFGIKKVPLWPKKFTKEELEQQRRQKEEEEKARKAQEEAEEQKRKEEEAKAKGAKGKAPAKSEQKSAVKTSGATVSSERPLSSMTAEAKPQQTAPKVEQSVDDRAVEWNFESYRNVLNGMSHATVGSMMAAMVFQIEKQSAKQIQQPTPLRATLMSNQSTHSISSVKPTEHNQLTNQLDDMLKVLQIEHATVEDGFKHRQPPKVDRMLKTSPYQVLKNENDKVGQAEEVFKFLNGKSASDYESELLRVVRHNWSNYLFKMPKTATRQKAERESDTQAILKYCPLDSHMTQRMIVLKHFEDLLHSNNPERTYEFTRRNCTEDLTADQFRQVLSRAMRLNPDINTCYFDKEDALLLAINYRNPPGRLLRKQWTYPINTMLDYPEYRRFVAGESLSFGEKVIDIDATKAGVMRTNSKFCFPCDNSVIRVDKYNVGSRRFGASLVVKDNMSFGIKERSTLVNDKVFGQDELTSMETKRSAHRYGEFWLEFENQTRMQVVMVENYETDVELIPANGGNAPKNVKRKTVSIDEPQSPLSQAQKSMMSDENRQPTAASQERRNLGTSHSNMSSVLLPQTAFSATVQAPKQPDLYDANKGASLTFTFNEGLVINVKPNGDIEQQNQALLAEKKPQSSILQEEKPEASPEVSRVVTRAGVVIKTLKNDNKVMYFPDGTITETDMKQGIWRTVNSLGIMRERSLRTNTAVDIRGKFNVVKKVDPETAAEVEIRDDGMLKVTYLDRKVVLVFPDRTQTIITKVGPVESPVTTTLVIKEGYAPVRIIDDQVKARSNTIIGLGGTDALMGAQNIMERSNGGLISEVLMPDRTVLQTYFEKQELPGYNRFSSSLIHMVRRDDFSVIKVRQDGEVVVITSNERSYLNEVGKQEQFGKTDYDYFFELFGVPNERRSGVYTCNLEQGRLWTQDEEGNYFIVYANGDSTEKLSVSFNLDQMVEGIENKEPSSPRVCEGDYIEEECKFLPPPKSVAEPRLFLVTNDGATEFFSETQLDYMFRTKHNDETVIKNEKKVTVDNEQAICHRFTKRMHEFKPEMPSTLPKDYMPKMPQCFDAINQTVSIANEPSKDSFLSRTIMQYRVPTDGDIDAFFKALHLKDELRANQQAVNRRLKIEPRELTNERVGSQNAIMMRIARKRGVNVQNLIAEEYAQIKAIDRDEKRQAQMDSLDDYFGSESAEQDTVGSENNE